LIVERHHVVNVQKRVSQTTPETREEGNGARIERNRKKAASKAGHGASIWVAPNKF